MEHQLLKVESDDEIETSEEPSDDSELEDEAFEADENEEPTHLFNDELKMPPYEHAKRQLSQLIGMTVSRCCQFFPVTDFEKIS